MKYKIRKFAQPVSSDIGPKVRLEHFHGSCIPEFRETKSAALLSEAKHLLLFEEDGDKQILRFAQNDRGGAVYTNTENALAPEKNRDRKWERQFRHNCLRINWCG